MNISQNSDHPLAAIILVAILCTGCRQSESVAVVAGNGIDEPIVMLKGRNSVELGVVLPSKEFLTVEFELRNEGNGALIIHKVHPSCSCSQVFAVPSRIEPGENGKIVMKLDRTKHGSHSATATVFCNCAEVPVFKVQSDWEVRGIISTSPLNFPRIDLIPGDSKELSLKIESEDKTILDTLQIQSILYGEVVGLNHTAQFEDGMCKFKISTSEFVKPGICSGSIEFKLDGTNDPIFSLDWNAVIQSPFAVTPSVLTLKPSVDGGYHVQLIVRVLDPVDFKDLSVASLDNSLTNIPFREICLNSNENIKILDLLVSEKLGASLEKVVVRSSQHKYLCEIPVLK